MIIHNDPNCAWINDLPKRHFKKIIVRNYDCDWLIIGAGYTGLSAARKLAQLHPSQKIIIADF